MLTKTLKVGGIRLVESQKQTRFVILFLLQTLKQYCLLEQVLKRPTSLLMDYCDNCACSCCFFLLVRSKKNKSPECSVNLYCGVVPVTLTLNVDAESHRSSNEAVYERLSRLDFTLFYLRQKNAMFETFSCTNYSQGVEFTTHCYMFLLKSKLVRKTVYSRQQIHEV